MMFILGNRSKGKTGNVISMDRFRNGRSLSPLRQAEAYWSALRTGDNIPHRSDIDPRGLENILEYTFILERIAPGIARFRLAGNHLTLIAGMEVRGMPITALFSATARAEITATIENVFLAPAIAELSLTAAPGHGAGAIEARAVLLPLKSDLGDVSRALGVLIADGPFGTGGLRFELSKSKLRTLTADCREKMRSPVPGLAEDSVPMLRGKPVLRVVPQED
ncbi:PAS domain-containing protein [Ruegeria marina]|uniref:PAS domain-containing protein n=1 Tax=Ruegeria marina TaxID=639004 RepID=A0A1G6IJG5_9RHOB|nr:PAS domain-containing protein [Ruegeria marina]SDC06657.1 PAS domain-containing protein [Ruegeria marina]